MKFWITKNPENGAFGGCIADFKPANTVGEAPLDAGNFPTFDDLDIIESAGVVTVTVNAAKKAARIKAQADKKAEEDAKNQARQLLHAELKSIKKGDIKNLQDLEDAFLKLRTAILG